MAAYQVLPATLDHGRFIAEHMRAPDRAEIWATAHLTPIEGIATSMKVSRYTFVGVADGVPFTVFGVMPFSLLSDTGAPWLFRHRRATSPRPRLLARPIKPGSTRCSKRIAC